jgi:hypothetical protein
MTQLIRQTSRMNVRHELLGEKHNSRKIKGEASKKYLNAFDGCFLRLVSTNMDRTFEREAEMAKITTQSMSV